MCQKDKILEKMKNNPRDDWVIGDLKSLAMKFGLEIRNVNHGSHVIFFHPGYRENISIPSNRHIKPIYVEKLTSFIERLEQ